MIGSRNPIDIFLKTKVNRARGGYRIARVRHKLHLACAGHRHWSP
jgi:hypothetical protein